MTDPVAAACRSSLGGAFFGIGRGLPFLADSASYALSFISVTTEMNACTVNTLVMSAATQRIGVPIAGTGVPSATGAGGVQAPVQHLSDMS